LASNLCDAAWTGDFDEISKLLVHPNIGDFINEKNARGIQLQISNTNLRVLNFCFKRFESFNFYSKFSIYEGKQHSIVLFARNTQILFLNF
jgi:hypothetical protein